MSQFTSPGHNFKGKSLVSYCLGKDEEEKEHPSDSKNQTSDEKHKFHKHLNFKSNEVSLTKEASSKSHSSKHHSPHKSPSKSPNELHKNDSFSIKPQKIEEQDEGTISFKLN